MFYRFFLMLVFCSCIAAQGINIVKQLKMIEKGQINQAQVDLENFKSEYPDHPDVIFLDAVLTSSGSRAFKKYLRIYKVFPDSRFADAAVFRMFSYHFALSNLKKANNYKIILEDEYPRSPYIKIARKNLAGINILSIQNSKKQTFYNNNLNLVNESSEKMSSKYKFTIQAGAFISKENANRLKERFIQRGFSVGILKKDVAGSVLNIVTVGEFTTIEEAKTALQSINREYDIRGRIIKPENYR